MGFFDLIEEPDDDELDDGFCLPYGRDSAVDDYRKKIQRKCRLPEEVPHELIPEIIDDIKFVRHEMEVLLPREFTLDDAYRLFYEHGKPSGMYYKANRYGGIEYDYEADDRVFRAQRYLLGNQSFEPADVLDSFDASLDGKGTMRPGYVDFPARDKAVVQLGVRRTHRPSPELAAEGLYYRQFGSDEWHWDYAAPELFAAIEKAVESRTTDDPFEWAYDRVRIAAGYSALGGGKECAPTFLADVYENFASTACNPPPPTHEKPRNYDLDEQDIELLTHLYARHDATVLPEAVTVVLEHAVLLTPEMLKAEPFASFFTHLPEMVENGFDVDSIMEFSHAESESGSSGLDRLKDGMELAMRIFRGRKPWWFKENLDMSEWFSDGKTKYDYAYDFKNDEHGRSVMLKIASHAGFAFADTMNAFMHAGCTLTALSPFSEDDAIEFTAFVTARFGIRNIPRFIRVFGHCTEVLAEVDESERRERLDQLKLYLEETRPQSEMFCRLEPKDSTLYKPGLNGFVLALEGETSRSRDTHELNINNTRLRGIEHKLALPLDVRARSFMPPLQPALAEQVQHKGLLAGSSNESRLALPAAEHALLANTVTSAVVGQFDFFEQLRQECGHLDAHVAKMYLTFSAVRMPDPWHPPKGFLRFLQVFDSIDTPGWRFAYLEHPKDRDAVHSENARKELGKQMLVSNMLDAWIMGLLTTDEMERLFSWMTLPLTDDRRKKIEEEMRLEFAKYPAVEVDLDEDEPEEYRDHRTPEEKRADRARHEKEKISMAINGEERQQKTHRLVALQETFVILSVINSMSIAGSFSKNVLASALRKAMHPIIGDLNGTPDDMGELIRPDLMSNLMRMSQHGAVDTDALRSSVEHATTPDEALETIQHFLEETVMKAMQQSIEHCLPNALAEVTDEMKRLRESGDPNAASNLATIVSNVRARLIVDLQRIWSGAPFAMIGIVDRLMAEFKIPDYAELFGPMHHFNTTVLPAHLPAQPDGAAFSDVTASNQHSARLLHFVGLRLIQEQRNRSEQGPFARLKQKYGTDSHVNVSAGASLVGKIVSRGFSDERAEGVDPYEVMAGQLPNFQERVDKWRLADMPLGPIGGRWHFDNPVSDRHLQLFTELLSLGQTPFRMIHSNTSLIIPGFNSRKEMKAFILMLALEGLIDPSKPELQVGISSRLSPELCAYFGSSAMLGTAECAPFKVDSFIANSEYNTWLTAARIVAYDAYPESAGERRNFELPFMFRGSPESSQNVQGRTDILGRWHVNCDLSDTEPDIFTLDDIDITHFVGAALRHVQYGGPLAEAGKAYMERHREILRTHGLSDTLDAPWVFSRETDASDQRHLRSTAHFDRCVKPCMDAHFAQAPSFGSGSGIVYDVRENIDTLRRQAETVREAIKKDPAYESHVRALLQVTPYESL